MDPLPTNNLQKPALAPFLRAISDVTRWRMLAELSKGEPLMVKELAAKVGHTADNVSKHIAILRKAGLVIIGRGGLYQIPAAYLPAPNEIDYGHCLLRMNRPE